MTADTSSPATAAEAATLAAWSEHWRRWAEERGRMPNVAQEGEGEAGLLRKMAVFGWVPPRLSPALSRYPDPFIGLSLTTGEVRESAFHAVMVVKAPGVHAGTPSDPWSAFGCAAVLAGKPAGALRALTIFRTYSALNPGQVHHELAASVVEAKSPGLDEERATKATRELAAAIADTVRGWGPGLGWDWPGLSKLPRLDGATMIPDTVDIGGLDLPASLDAVAGFLEGIGPEGKKAAKGVRKVDPAALWADPAGPRTAPDAPTRSPLLWALACVLWADVVGPALDRAAAIEVAARVRQGRAALVAPVHSQIGDALWPARLDAGRIVSADEQLPLPFMVTSVQSDLPVEVLGSETAQRFMRWVIRAAAAADSAQCYAPVPGAPGVTVTRLEGGSVEVAVVGGVSRLAEVIGAKSKKAADAVADTLSVLSGVYLREMFGSLQRGSGGVLIHCPDERRGRGGGERKLTFIVHAILCPGAVKKFPRALSGEDRILIPVLSPPVIPAGFERGTTPAALFRLDWAVGRFLARHRRAVKAQGGAVVPWDALAKAAGVTPKALEAALLLWFAPGPIQRFEGKPDGLCMYASNGEPDAAAARRFVLEGADKVEARALRGAKGRGIPKTKTARKTSGRSPP